MTMPQMAIDVAEEESYEVLAALHSGYAYSERWRKIVIAGCRESIRASAAISGQKLSEARIDDLAHLSSAYLSFIEAHLRSRIKFERAFLEKGGLQ